MCIARRERDVYPSFLRASLGDRKHFARGIDASDSSAAAGECNRRAACSGADVEDASPADRRQERRDHTFLGFSNQASDRSAEAHRIERFGHRRIGIDGIAVVVGARRTRRGHATPPATCGVDLAVR